MTLTFTQGQRVAENPELVVDVHESRPNVCDMTVVFVWEMTSKKYCKYGRYGCLRNSSSCLFICSWGFFYVYGYVLVVMVQVQPMLKNTE